MRKHIVAGNWKMNNNAEQTFNLIEALKAQAKTSNAQVMIAPTFVNLQSAAKQLENNTIEVAAQNMHVAANGAYTGEVSAEMIQSIGINTVILKLP